MTDGQKKTIRHPELVIRQELFTASYSPSGTTSKTTLLIGIRRVFFCE